MDDGFDEPLAERSEEDAGGFALGPRLREPRVRGVHDAEGDVVDGEGAEAGDRAREPAESAEVEGQREDALAGDLSEDEEGEQRPVHAALDLDGSPRVRQGDILGYEGVLLGTHPRRCGRAGTLTRRPAG